MLICYTRFVERFTEENKGIYILDFLLFALISFFSFENLRSKCKGDGINFPRIYELTMINTST